jgi:hypothetical protein
MSRSRIHTLCYRIRRYVSYQRRNRKHILQCLLWLIAKILVLPLTLIVSIHNQRKVVTSEYKGIRLLNYNPDFEGDTTFAECTKDALALIEQHDPRRFQRIQREVRSIESRVEETIGRYQRKGRRCVIDFARYQELTNEVLNPQNRGTDEYRWYLAHYATTLIHEATHGKIYSFEIPYMDDNYVQIERLCCREEQRFAARLPQDTYDFANDLVEEFDSTFWDNHRKQSFLQHLRVRLKRYDENEERQCRRKNETDGRSSTESREKTIAARP